MSDKMIRVPADKAQAGVDWWRSPKCFAPEMDDLFEYLESQLENKPVDSLAERDRLAGYVTVLRRHLQDALREFVWFHDDFLELFKSWLDNQTFHGVEMARWRRAAIVAKEAEAALAATEEGGRDE